MLEIFIPAFVTLFVVIDPPGIAPIFASLTDGTSREHKTSMAYRSVMVGSFIILLFAFAGEWLLGALGIGLDAFRVAGGVMLFIIALEMVFEKRTERRENRAEQVVEDYDEDIEHEDISVFPMGIPMIAGPGTIATIMLYMSRFGDDWTSKAMVLAAAAVILVLTLIVLLLSDRIMKLMGKTFSAMLTRLLGVILAAMAGQLIIDGVKGAFA